MLVVQPENRIPIPIILRHPWLRTLDSLEEDLSDDADDHDFQVSLQFGRSECNFNPLFGSVGGGESYSSLQATEQSLNPMHQGGNINELNIENLFRPAAQPVKQAPTTNTQPKLSYKSYCAVTEDFGTHRIDEEALRVLETFGFNRSKVIQSLN